MSVRLKVANLQPGTEYAVQVRALANGLASEWSERYVFVTDQNLDLPAAPATVTWNVSEDAFIATWTPVELDMEGDPAVIVSYELEFEASSVTKIISVAPQTGANLSYTLTYAENVALFGTPQPTVALRVRAVNNKNIKGAWSGALSASNPVPANVTGFDAQPLIDAVELSWTANTEPDLDRYAVYASTSGSGFTPGPGNLIFTGKVTRFVYRTASYVPYYFKIFALDKFNQPSATAASDSATPVDPSSGGSDTTPPDNATSFNGTPGFDTTNQQSYINFAWTASATPADVNRYEIRYGLDGSTWEYLVTPGDVTTARLTNLIPGRTYYTAIRAIDEASNASTWLNATTYPITTTADTSAPSIPQTPTAVAGSRRVQVTVTGFKADGTTPMEPDVAYYEVYGSTTTGFSIAASNMLGTVQKGPAMVETFQLPAQNSSGSTQQWFIKVRAVDLAGNVSSAASAQATATVGLIDTANISDLAVTNAKIATIEANKITAGTGLINDLTVKSILTLGDASTNGVIQSFDYVAATTGYKLEKNALEINQGTIRAAALRLQIGANIIPAQYADFEFQASYYTNNLTITGGTWTIDTTDKKFNSQSLRWAATGASTLYLASSTTGYNIDGLLPNTAYIVSYYAMMPTGGTGRNITTSLKYETSTTPATTAGTPTNTVSSDSTWARKTTTITTGASVTGRGLLLFDTPGSGNIYIDGIQIEQKVTGATTASTWAAPGFTAMDGGAIRTGSITSTADALDALGNPITGYKAWSINTAGSATFGNALIRGSLVMGLNGAEPVVDPSDPDSEDLTGVSMMKSYNYIAGLSGWIIKSNGNAEFLQLAANSISATSISAVSPDKLQPGIITADLYIGSSFIAVESETLYVTAISRTSNLATLTVSGGHTRLVGDKIQVRLDQDSVSISPATPDATFDTPGNTFATITAVTPTTISYNQAVAPFSGGLSDKGATSYAGTSYLYVEGRKTVTSPAGITLFNNDGETPVVDLPTDPQNSAYFAGNIQANSLTVLDDFLLQGLENYLNAGSVFTLNAGVVSPPSTPSYSPYWDQVATWMSTEVAAWQSGLYYDSAGSRYITTNSFFGAQAMSYGHNDGGFSGNDDCAGDNTGPYGLTKIGSNYFVLVSNSAGEFRVRKYVNSGTGFSTVDLNWLYDEHAHSTFSCTQAEWEINEWGNSALKAPCIGTDGTNIYLARPNQSGSIVVSWHDPTTGSRIGITKTNINDNQDLKSLNVGTFDFSGTRWIITTGGTSSKQARNYVTNTSGTHQTTETWLSPGTVKISGTTWNGTQFVTLGQNMRHYWHSSVAKSGTNVWHAKSTWYNGSNEGAFTIDQRSGTGTSATLRTTATHGYDIGDIVYVTSTGTSLDNAYYTLTGVTTNTLTFNANYTSGTVASGGLVTNWWETPLPSASAQITVTRRANMTLSSTTIPGGAGEQPDRANFYLSNTGSGGTYNRQLNPNQTNTMRFTTDPSFSSGAGTQYAFPQGTPAKIVSNNGLLELSSDGTALFGSAEDPNTLAGNLPPLRVGDPVTTHLRLGRSQILAMLDDDTQATLNLNTDATGDGPVQIRGMIKNGIKNSGSISANTDKTVSVTFGTPFPSTGPVPTITLTAEGVTALTNAPSFSAVSITRSGFDIVLRRGNTTAFDIAWHAIATVPS